MKGASPRVLSEGLKPNAPKPEISTGHYRHTPTRDSANPGKETEMNAVAKTEQAQELQVHDGVTPMLAMIERAARDPAIDVDKFERLLAVKERIEAKDAEAAFNAAMVEVQSEIGRIAANKENSQTRSWYATYATLDRIVRPVYVRHGFSLSFNTDDIQNDVLIVVCYVSHSAGHTRTYSVPMPADGKGAKGGDVMTKTHAAGSAMSYGQRYLLKLIFNLAIGVDPNDDDGNAAGGKTVDPSWFDALEAATDEASLRDQKAGMVKAWGKATSIPKELVSAYNARLDALRAATKAAK